MPGTAEMDQGTPATAPAPHRGARRRTGLLLVLLVLVGIAGAAGARRGLLGQRAQVLFTSGPIAVKDQPLRRAYEREVMGLAARAAELQRQGLPPRDIALALYQERRALSTKYQELTPEPLRSRIYQINRERYGDPHGPTFAYLERKHTRDGVVDYQAVIRGAYQPNRDVDRLLREGPPASSMPTGPTVPTGAADRAAPGAP